MYKFGYTGTENKRYLEETPRNKQSAQTTGKRMLTDDEEDL